MSDDLTPIRQQYLEIKRQYPDTILFFRLGDFYETFDQDAEITARELDIVLTSRPIGKGLRAPLAGIPYHAVDNYLSRLIGKGYHVAICEQLGDQPSKGIFPRQVVRVVTPGTLIDSSLLPGDRNNYLVSIYIENDRVGFSYVDISTGEFFVTEIASALPNSVVDGEHSWSQLRGEITRISPAEIIHPQNSALPVGIASYATSRPNWQYDLGKCSQVLCSHFELSSIGGLGLSDAPLAVRSAGAIIQYLQETDPAAIKLLTHLKIYHLGDFMVLDGTTRRNLELTQTFHGEVEGSLLGILDKTVTPMGRRLISQWINQPLLSVEKIRERQDGVDFFFTASLFRIEFQSSISKLADLERLVNRISSGHAQPRELVSLRSSLGCLPEIAQMLQSQSSKCPVPLEGFSTCSPEFTLLSSALADDPPATLHDTGVFRTNYSVELDGINDSSIHAREWINNLEVLERERTGIKSLKVGFNKVFGYYIEISKGQSHNAPADYIRKQTLVNGERYITPEMKEYELLVLNAEERIHELEKKLFSELCLTLSKSAPILLSTARVLAQLDTLASFAEIAAKNGYIRPIVTSEGGIEIRDGRHPVVEGSLAESRFIPNDIIFEPGEIVRLITGPNMSGKSTYLRQAALLILMAQIGSYIPASSARFGIIDRIFTRIGAQDEIQQGHSTFMVEMIETANILHHASPKSLLILDEIGRGTSTYDGVAIAWAVIEYIHNHPTIRSKTLFATHYHELTHLADLLPGIRNYNVAVSEAGDQVVFLHKIIPGGADRSYGIHVAQIAGLPKTVIQRAGEIMSELEKTTGRAIQIEHIHAQQAALFPESNPLLNELSELDMNTLSPIEALNKLYEMRKKYIS